MKIIPNIPNGIKLFRSVGIFNAYLKKLQKLRESGAAEEERELLAYATGLWVERVFDLFDVTIHITGQENIPAEGACVFIANHQGYGDIPVLIKVAEGRQIGFVAKDSLQKVPYFGKWITAIHGVFLKRGDTREALKSIQDGVQTLKDGYSLVIFPEGTRSHTTEMGEFKAGSFKLATRAKVPIVPVSVNGTRHMFEDRDVITKGAVVDVIVHPSIDTASMDRHRTANITQEVEDTIRKGLDTLVEIEKAREAGKE